MRRWRDGGSSADDARGGPVRGSRARRGSRRIALLYLGVAALWILLSDRLLELFDSPSESAAVSTLKGLLFVVATAWMLYGLVLRLTTTLERSERRLQAALGERDESARRKDQFLAALSHELRNPLSPIVTSVRVLERCMPSGDERARRSVAIIGRQATHLARLLDDLLDATRLTRGKFAVRPSRFDLGTLARQTLEDLGPVLAGRALVARLDGEPLFVRADPTRIRQALGNLLTNAAKFTSEGGRIEVSLRQAGGRALLQVADDGVGLDEPTRQRLFEPFFQADDTLDRKNGGLGLGLALVKGIAELHGGSVRAESEGPGRGARFTLELPLDRTAVAEGWGTAGPRSAQASSSPSIALKE
ncbi:MAG TPA: HAMP domain-containing sensor histidine kinase [Myxococcales bacterium]|jgi:signal transduction histidine kinase